MANFVKQLFTKEGASKGIKHCGNVRLGIWPIGEFADSVDLIWVDVVFIEGVDNQQMKFPLASSGGNPHFPFVTAWDDP